MSSLESWRRYQRYLCGVPSLLTLDVSRMHFEESDLARLEPALQRALGEMEELERGAIANPDEGRRVGHYWLRAPERAPTAEIAAQIREALAAVHAFAREVHEGKRRPGRAPSFTQLLSIGIGGSALGPMFVSDALGQGGADRLAPHFVDNTDPDGIARTLAELRGRLGETLFLVNSKSGGTPETHNGMALVAAACREAGLDFAGQAVAITLPGSKLDRRAEEEGWLARFPMFDWVGGRTSVLSAAGLLPAAMQGLDIDGLLEGAAACDRATRERDSHRNPAALLAQVWHQATGGRGAKAMVVLPYKDRLALLGRYLQQLVMESLGKHLDREGHRVEQGLTVYGNKGSTDQHAYVQQLRDGLDNFFAVFVRVLEPGAGDLEVEPGVRVGDYLDGFLLGTREALAQSGRESILLSLPRVDARSVGAMIALFERTVGLYAGLIGVNAYHQPGVEAGKRAAATALELQGRVLAALSAVPRTAEELAAALGEPERAEEVYLLLEHLCAGGRARAARGGAPAQAAFVGVSGTA